MFPCAFYENCKKVSSSVSVTMHSAWQATIYAIIRIIFPRTLTEGEKGERGWERREENGARQEKNDRGQRRWVSGAFARKPNRLPRDCGAMADSWLRARVIGERTEKSMRSSTRFRFGWGDVGAFSHRTALVSHTISPPVFSLPHSFARLQETDEEEINASPRNLYRERGAITKT